MSYLDTIGACECNDAERADRARGYLGWYHDLAEVLAHYPQPREGWSFNNIETRSVWIYDGVRWCNTTQGNPFTMITHPNVSGTVRDGYPSTFYYVPNTTGLTRFNFVKPNGLTQGSVSIDVDIKSISDIVFIEWTGSELHASVHILDVDVVRHKDGMLYDVNGDKIELAELVEERQDREENEELLSNLITEVSTKCDKTKNEFDKEVIRLDTADSKLREVIGFIHRPVFLNAGLDVEFVDELFSPTQPTIARVTVGLLSEDRNSRDITIGHRLSNIGDVSLTINNDTYREVHKIEYADGTVGYIVLNENVFDEELFPANTTYIVEATRLVSPADNPSSYAQYQSDSIVKDLVEECQEREENDELLSKLITEVNQKCDDIEKNVNTEVIRLDNADSKLREVIGFIHRPVFLNAGLDVEFVDELFSPTQPTIARVTVGLLSEDRNSRDITIGHRLSNIGDVSLTIDKDTYRQVHKIEYADGTVGYIVLNENVFDEELFPANKTYIVEATRLVSPADNPSSYAQYQSDSKGSRWMPATPSGDPMHMAYVSAGAVWDDVTQTWSANGRSGLSNSEIRSLYNKSDMDELFFRKLWNKSCLVGTAQEYGRYNPITCLYELNGIWDLTFDEAFDIYVRGNNGIVGNSSWNSVNNMRTTLEDGNINFIGLSWCSMEEYNNVHAISDSSYLIPFSDSSQGTRIYYCRKLRRITPIIYLYNYSLQTHIVSCKSLKHISLYRPKKSAIINMWNDNEHISYYSLYYLIYNANQAFTLKVDANTFAYLSGTADSTLLSQDAVDNGYGKIIPYDKNSKVIPDNAFWREELDVKGINGEYIYPSFKEYLAEHPENFATAEEWQALATLAQEKGITITV